MFASPDTVQTPGKPEKCGLNASHSPLSATRWRSSGLCASSLPGSPTVSLPALILPLVLPCHRPMYRWKWLYGWKTLSAPTSATAPFAFGRVASCLHYSHCHPPPFDHFSAAACLHNSFSRLASLRTILRLQFGAKWLLPVVVLEYCGDWCCGSLCKRAQIRHRVAT